jgi:hypothetical protein
MNRGTSPADLSFLAAVSVSRAAAEHAELRVKRLAVSVHYICMAQEFVLAAGGMALVAAGAWRFESRASRTGAALAMLLCLCGIAIIAIAAARSESRCALRLAILGTYSGAGGVLGSTIWGMLVNRRAGAILATIGMVVPARTKILWVGIISIGIVGVVMQIIDAQRSTSLLMPIGQAWLFATFGIQVLLMAGTRWVLAERGIIGAKLFVPWQQVLACDWQDSNTLGIATKPGIPRPSQVYGISCAGSPRASGCDTRQQDSGSLN